MWYLKTIIKNNFMSVSSCWEKKIIMYNFVLFTNLNLRNFGTFGKTCQMWGRSTTVSSRCNLMFFFQDSSSVDNTSTFNVDYLHHLIIFTDKIKLTVVEKTKLDVLKLGRDLQCCLTYQIFISSKYNRKLMNISY